MFGGGMLGGSMMGFKGGMHDGVNGMMVGQGVGHREPFTNFGGGLYIGSVQTSANMGNDGTPMWHDAYGGGPPTGAGGGGFAPSGGGGGGGVPPNGLIPNTMGRR